MKIRLSYLAALITLSINAQENNNVQGSSVSDIEKITVVGTNQKRYLIESNESLTGFPVDFLDLPRVVNIIPEQVILDQKITDLSEALRNSPGISLGDGFGGTNDDFLIRGFRRNTVYRNGFRRETNFKTNLSNVEYTQVIRGPASITYGQVEPGGLVDVVTKKPLFESRVSGEARIGSFNDKFFLLDVSQPLTENIRVRVVASTQDAESFRDFTDISRDTISISSAIDFTNSTSLDLSYEYRDESRPLDRGTITVPTENGREVINELLDIPTSRRFGERFEVFESEFNFAEATLNHSITDNWSLKLSAAVENSSANDLQARPVGLAIFDKDGPITEDGFITFQNPADIATILGNAVNNSIFDDPTDQAFLLRRTDGSQDQDVEVFYANALLTGEVEIGNINHRLAMGADYRDSETTRFFVSTPFTNGVQQEIGGNGPLFNVSKPIYGNLVNSLGTEGVPIITAIEKNTGAFVNDYIEITDKFNILTGLRYDTFEIDGDTPVSEADQFSPQLAANYNLSNTTSMFASYSTSFEPNTAVNSLSGKNEAFEPEDSEQYELGFKAELFDGNLQASASIYNIQKNNILSTDENDLPILIEGQSSKGSEISISGQPTSGMNIIAGYSYVDAEIGTGKNSSNRPRNVAKDTFNLWASYEVQSGRFEGAGFGAGAFYVGDRYGDDNNSYTLDAYTVVDISAWYTLSVQNLGVDDTLRFQLALKNIFDEEYYSASGGDLRISIGAPRTIFASVSFDF